MIEAVSQLASVGQITRGSPVGGSMSSVARATSDFASQLVASVREGEGAALAGLNGALPMQQVVETVLEADRAVTTLISVRDKAVGALLELSRMQV
jgi:flagellar hook-basal body complex protein FliE